MNEGVKAVIYPSRTSPRPRRYWVADQDIGLDPQGHAKGMTGPLAHYNVDDILATLKALLDAGSVAQDEVRDVGGGKLIATVEDADGNPIGLIQPA